MALLIILVPTTVLVFSAKMQLPVFVSFRTDKIALKAICAILGFVLKVRVLLRMAIDAIVMAIGELIFIVLLVIVVMVVHLVIILHVCRFH